jgi:DNA polymerase-1
LSDVQVAYIRQDISVPALLYERQQEAIATHELARAVTVEHQALPAIAAMEIHGVCIDVARWRDILASRSNKRKSWKRKFSS